MRGTECLQLSSLIVSFAWKPAHFRLRSYGSAFFPFRKQEMSFLTVDAIIGKQAFQNG